MEKKLQQGSKHDPVLEKLLCCSLGGQIKESTVVAE